MKDSLFSGLLSLCDQRPFVSAVMCPQERAELTAGSEMTGHYVI